MNILKKIKSYFDMSGYSFGKEDVSSLVREQLKGVQINFSEHNGEIEAGLDENEIRELCAEADKIKSSKTFSLIASHLIDIQGNYSMKEAETMEQVAFGRATINGISLFVEEVERLSDLHREANKRDEVFDKFASI